MNLKQPTKPPKPAKPAPQASLTTIFSGYPPKLIAQWCGVSYNTASMWKRGERIPSRRAVRLFLIHSRGEVMPSSWKGWRFHEKTGELVSPDGAAFSPGRLVAYEFLNRNGEFREGYKRLPRDLLEALVS